MYRPFEAAPPGPTGRVYHHEIPGGQLSNLRAQAGALGLADRFEEIEQAYAGSDRLLGRPVKVTPSSKVVGDLALALVGAGVSAEDFAENPHLVDVPDSVVGFLRGELGTPAGGWPRELRRRVLTGRGIDPDQGPPAPLAVAEEDRHALDEPGPVRRETLSRLLFPGPAAEFAENRRRYGDTSGLSANQFFYGLRPGEEHRVALDEGVEVLIRLEAIGEPDDKGMRSVLLVVNGQLRPLLVRDESVETSTPVAEKADRSVPGHVAAPFGGAVTVTVAVGDTVEAGGQVGSIEAMKMEAAITSPVGGVVARVLVPTPRQVDAGDLLIVVQ